MTLITVLIIAIIVLSILLIISVIFNILLWKGFKESNQQLRWYDMSTRYSGKD